MNRRKMICMRCGQCCGADGKEGWPKHFPDALSDITEEEINNLHPVIGLIGIPRDTGVTSGSVIVDDKVYTYEWLESGGLVKQGSETECPFLYYHKEDGPYLCGLADTSEDWRWKKQCAWYPKTEMNDYEVKMFLEDYPKCSYRWKPMLTRKR
jgi:hypothetical protein